MTCVQNSQMCEQEEICTILVDEITYVPDTIDLSTDSKAADYWFDCFKTLIRRFAKQAVESQKNDPTAKERAESFKSEYLSHIEALRYEKNKDHITIRYLFNLSDIYLNSYGFEDPWLQQKRTENDLSILQLKTRLKEIDSLGSYLDKWTELVKGVLAGNIFDWGAKAVSEILKNEKSFGLNDALKKLQERPWLIDHLDSWLKRLQGPRHKCAVIFVDNSGIDIVLGMLPFARELLKRKTKVLLCANAKPSFNDITANELEDIIKKCCVECEILKNAYKEKELLIYNNGQGGPCLDMRQLSKELCDAIKKNETDLLIIEGMGRALHTNLNAKFSCETLKLAVVKNEWLANRLGGEIFSVICKYEC